MCRCKAFFDYKTLVMAIFLIADPLSDLGRVDKVDSQIG